ncbi:HAD-IA family hydrolase [Lactococcus garvieae]|uniref:Hydrolase, haloacid dehalogenase-like family n=1 Tax=Lactococcus garvieae DCC43 TaxID=1231377 RepID=K2PLN1_9LACT|nr:HAD-IA family hydrolase [Lactococcus garvieae]EKF51119.1 hydrolase, haloacid dehalogenase-like family [Lactococcus garvieae DCC43]
MEWKNYIWDFDGTLFDTYPVMLVALRETMKQMSVEYPGDLEAYIKRFSIRKFAQEFANQDFLDLYHKLELELQDNPQVYTEIPDILSKIVKNGGRNFVLSHRDDSTFEYLGELRKYFTEIITSQQNFARKPSPEALEYLLNKYQLNPHETVMIGDRPLDIEAGINAGVATLLLDEKGYFGDIADQNIRKWSEWK